MKKKQKKLEELKRKGLLREKSRFAICKIRLSLKENWPMMESIL